MKKYLLLMFFALFTFSCTEDFLEETDKDKIIPKTIAEYSELLYGEGYINGNKLAEFTPYMGDELCSKTGRKGWFGITDNRNNVFGYFCWQQEPEYNMNLGISEDRNWEQLYHSILLCNIIIDAMKEAEGSEREKQQLLGEAYFVRALNYYYLINLYGEPYINGEEKGVPINNLIGMEDVRFKRSSTGEVYNLIKTDLKKSIQNFESSNTRPNIFKGNLKASYLLASRVYLYTKEWEECIKYSELLENEGSSLKDLTKDFVDDEIWINSKNPEILYTYGAYETWDTGATYHFTLSEEMVKIFKNDNDMRSKAFFTENYYGDKIFGKNGNRDITGTYGYALRTSELYLNKAEAEAHLGNTNTALETLNKLRRCRYLVLNRITDLSKENILKEIYLERKIEFCLEGQRWFDLRRQGCPELTHYLMIDYKTKGLCDTYILEKNDKAYTLPLPKNVSEMETSMIDIKRPDRIHK